MKTINQIIDETVEYYSDVSKRSKSGSNCLYNSPNGNVCAFQRVCKPIPKKYEDMSAGSVLNNEGLELLKEDYRLPHNTFWNSIQLLHDTDDNWNEKGLSPAGEKYVQRIKENYKDITF